MCVCVGACVRACVCVGVCVCASVVASVREYVYLNYREHDMYLKLLNIISCACTYNNSFIPDGYHHTTGSTIWLSPHN